MSVANSLATDSGDYIIIVIIIIISGILLIAT